MGETTELKPCPFCGEMPTTNGGGNSVYGRFWWAVGCNPCGVYFNDDEKWDPDNQGKLHPDSHPKECFEVWNTRAAPMVKPLVWLGGGCRYHTEFGFVIEKIDSPRRVIWRLLQADFGTTYRADFGGKGALEKAKELAETIHSRRILDALA